VIKAINFDLETCTLNSETKKTKTTTTKKSWTYPHKTNDP